ncbi:recombinase family protein [Clostridium sp. P21]|uniref:Recombinase family protein n=1 Tax=Clostridium muellerianum TaxID=2716538 RepID=A0A7Y0HQQ9_9CLOT|nr:recombinase family protein [Clostridium muellerianum]
MDKVAIYCRLSDEDKNKRNVTDDSESIINQKSMLIKYAVDKGWNIYKIYSDDDYSGLDAERPEFNQMIVDAEVGKFNIILCKTQSRFTRDMELVEKYLHNKFIEWNVRFVTVVDKVDTYEKSNKKSRQINGLVNEWYCEDISDSIRAVFKSKQSSGKFIGSFACYGYMKDESNKNKLVIDEEASEVVRLIFKLYLQGNGIQHIVHILNEKGIPNPTKYKRLKGFKYVNSQAKDQSGLWNKTTIKRILKNEMYLGNMVQHKRQKVSYKSKKIKELSPKCWIRVKNTHPSIIEEQTFNKVQKRLKSNIRSTGTGQAHLFASKVKCMDCNSTMQKVTNGKGYQYLRCKIYCVLPKGKKLCTSHSINLSFLEDIVSSKIKNYFRTLCSTENLTNKLMLEECIPDKLKHLENELVKINKDINKRMEALKRLYLEKISGEITTEQYNEFAGSFEKDKNQLLLKRSKLEGIIDETKQDSDEAYRYTKIVENYKSFDKLTHIMVDELIDYIEVGEKDRGTGKQNIRIHWNF